MKAGQIHSAKQFKCRMADFYQAFQTAVTITIEVTNRKTSDIKKSDIRHQQYQTSKNQKSDINYDQPTTTQISYTGNGPGFYCGHAN